MIQKCFADIREHCNEPDIESILGEVERIILKNE